VKECYQCGKEVHWLAPDSRCGDCTRLTPEQVRGEEPMPDEADEALAAFCKKYDLKKEDFNEEYMETSVGYVKDNYIQLNIFYGTAYDLFINGQSIVYKKITEDKELLSFITLANQVLSKL
jgi:hypothetical protein